jgi:hypothetical protein
MMSEAAGRLAVRMPTNVAVVHRQAGLLYGSLAMGTLANIVDAGDRLR